MPGNLPPPMSPTELQAAKDELALLRAEQTRRILKGKVESAGNGTESVRRQFATYDQLLDRIRELEAQIAAASPCAYGAIHLR